ncbi:hypothetical protein [Eisenbergiella tayi]|jgi:hypothetical protein|uniref:hypothetical protein n=1 Tax=Eisenbergiella tayi TaxID=1432052 RepID=UPI00243222DB|nr:hypothetical protein [Eisenbergiella tayi]
MAGKAKFDQEAAFKAIVGADHQSAQEPSAASRPVAGGGKNKDRVQRSYFIDRDLDKALRKMGLEEDKKLTEVVNEILRVGLQKYL